MEPEKTIQEKLQAAAPQLNWDRERVWAGLEINTGVKKKPVMWHWWASAAVTVSVVLLTLWFSADKEEQYAVRGKRGTEIGKRETEIGKRGMENGERKEGIADSGTYKIKLSKSEKIRVIAEVSEEMVHVDPAPELSEVEPLIVENVVNEAAPLSKKVKKRAPRIQAILGVHGSDESNLASNEPKSKYSINLFNHDNPMTASVTLRDSKFFKK